MKKSEHITCPLCSSKKEIFLFERDGFRVVRCESCSLTYINPRLTLKSLTDLYNDNKISPEQYYEANIPQDIRNFKKRIKLISKIKKYPGHLLDIGCNIGTFMHVAEQKGWKTTGVEFNRSAVKFGKKRFNLNIFERDFMKTRFKKNTFDVVTMNDVIEHVIDPVTTLHEVHRILKKGGLLFMSTPNIAAPVARLSGKRWLHIKPNEHLHFFTPNTINRLLKTCKFKMTKHHSIGRIRNLETILVKSKTYSSLPYTIACIIPKRVREAISIPINPGDEMAVYAIKQ